MGLSYSYEIITAREAAFRLVESLAAHLVPDDADRLMSAARRAPERLMEVIARKKSYEAHSLCLSFLFVSDKPLAA
jgi:hypothetical protein